MLNRVNPFSGISAGSTQATSGNVVFSNSNGVSFGLSGNTVTASVGTNAGGVGLSAGTQSVNTGTVNFANSNGIAFGMSGSSRITASYTVPNTAGLISAVNVSAGTTSNNLSALTFSNANGVSFGLNGSLLTGTVATNYQSQGAYLTTADLSQNSSLYAGTGFTSTTAAGAVVAGTQNTAGLKLAVPAYLTTADLSQNSSLYAGTGFTTTTAAGVVVAGTHNTAGLKLAVPAYLTTAMQSNAATISNINVSAGTTSTNASAYTFSNANGVSFGIGTGASAGVVTGSVAAAGGAQTGISSIAAAGGTQTAGMVSFANSNGLTFGMSTGGVSGTMTASYTVPTVTNSSWIVSDAATSGTVARLAFTNLNGMTLSLSTGAGGSHTIVGSYTVPSVTNSSWTVSDAATSLTVSRLAFTNVNGLTLTLSTAAGAATVRGSYTVPTTAGLISAVNLSAGTTSNNLSALTFSNSNGVSFGLNASTVTASVAAQTVQTQNCVDVTLAGNTSGALALVSSGTLTLAGGNNITLSQAGNAITISGAAGGGGGAVNFSAGTTSNNLGSVVFSNANGVSFGLNGSTITAAGNLNIYGSGNTSGTSSGTPGLTGLTLNAATGAALTVTANNSGWTLSVPQTSMLSATGWASLSTNGSTISVGASTTAHFYAVGNTFGTSSGTGDIAVMSLSGIGQANVAASNSGWVVSVPNVNKSWLELNDGARITTALAITATQFSNRPFFQPFWNPANNLNANTFRFLASGGASTGASSALRLTAMLGFYTFVNSTSIALVSSTSNAFSLSTSSLWNGVRIWDITGLSNLTLSQGQWVLGLNFSVSGTNNSQNLLTIYGPDPYPNWVGFVSGGSNNTSATNASSGPLPFLGVYSVTSAGLPAGVQKSIMSMQSSGVVQDIYGAIMGIS